MIEEDALDGGTVSGSYRGGFARPPSQPKAFLKRGTAEERSSVRHEALLDRRKRELETEKTLMHEVKSGAKSRLGRPTAGSFEEGALAHDRSYKVAEGRKMRALNAAHAGRGRGRRGEDGLPGNAFFERLSQPKRRPGSPGDISLNEVSEWTVGAAMLCQFCSCGKKFLSIPETLL